MAAPKNKTNRVRNLHIGSMGWSYPFWVGDLYPENLEPKEYLAEYSKHFNSVELDNTFYRIPSANTVTAWREQTPEGFLFSAKFPKIITHIKMLQNCEEDVDRFFSSMSHLQSKLGPLLLQFPSSFGANRFSLLQDFLPSLPRGHRYAVEVRNKNLMGQELCSVLRENNVSLVLVAQPNGPMMREATADFIYVRWEGDRKEVSGTLGKVEVERTEDMRKWAALVKEFLDMRLEIFGYFSKYYSGYPPSDARKFLDALLK